MQDGVGPPYSQTLFPFLCVKSFRVKQKTVDTPEAGLQSLRTAHLLVSNHILIDTVVFRRAAHRPLHLCRRALKELTATVQLLVDKSHAPQLCHLNPKHPVATASELLIERSGVETMRFLINALLALTTEQIR